MESGARRRDGRSDEVAPVSSLWLVTSVLGELAARLGFAVGGGDVCTGSRDPRSALEASAAALLEVLSVAASICAEPYEGIGTTFMRPVLCDAWYSRADTSQPGDQPSVSRTAACRMRSCTREPG